MRSLKNPPPSGVGSINEGRSKLCCSDWLFTAVQKQCHCANVKQASGQVCPGGL
jgi:hypothetical protein